MQKLFCACFSSSGKEPFLHYRRQRQPTTPSPNIGLGNRAFVDEGPRHMPKVGHEAQGFNIGV